MVLRPPKYGVTTILILTSSLWYYDHSNMVLLPLEHLTSPRIEEEYIFKIIFIMPKKGIMILKYHLF